MADPKLTRTSVQIKYTSSDGYRAEFGGKAGTGSKHLKTGEEVPPQHALLAALEELSRLTALFGFEEDAKKAFDEPRARVAEWKASRTKQAA